MALPASPREVPPNFSSGSPAPTWPRCPLSAHGQPTAGCITHIGMNRSLVGSLGRTALTAACTGPRGGVHLADRSRRSVGDTKTANRLPAGLTPRTRPPSQTVSRYGAGFALPPLAAGEATWMGEQDRKMLALTLHECWPRNVNPGTGQQILAADYARLPARASGREPRVPISLMWTLRTASHGLGDEPLRRLAPCLGPQSVGLVNGAAYRGGQPGRFGLAAFDRDGGVAAGCGRSVLAVGGCRVCALRRMMPQQASREP